MTSLLCDLYRFRQRETKNALEDFLTESLAAIMRALPLEHLASFLEAVTGQDCAGYLSSDIDISIATQLVIEREGVGNQRPDLVVLLDNEPWLLFENKVAASLDQSIRKDGTIESQLHRYAAWLDRQQFTAPGLTQALCYITHNTSVPPDYVEEPPLPIYGKLGRQHSNWGKIGRILETITSALPNVLHCRALVEGFMEFLEDQGLSNEYPTPNDIALLGLYMGSAEKVGRIAEEMLYIAEGVATAVSQRAYSIIERDIGIFSSSRNLRIKGWPPVQINVGIWYPNEGDGWYIEELRKLDAAINLSPKIFIQLYPYNEGDDTTDILGVPSPAWYRPEGDFLTCIDFDAIYGTSDDKHQTIMNWTRDRVAELKGFLATVSVESV